MERPPDAMKSRASAASADAGRSVRAGRWVALVVRLGRRRMRDHNAMAISASLSFQTVFALVPALVLAFLILKAAGVVENGKRSLRGILEAAGLSQISVREQRFDSNGPPGDSRPRHSRPAATAPVGAADANAPAYNLVDQIESAVDGVEKKMTFSRLGPVGLFLLAWAAISLLTTMEQSLNRIFEAPRARPLALRVFLYWSAITFLPIVGLAFGFLATEAARFVSGQAALAGLIVVLDIAANLGLGILVLACIYRYLPSVSVPFRHALFGAAVVVPLWIAARWGFALYLSQVVAKGNEYGALGLLPLFLIWVNLCWYGFLLGGEVAFVSSRWRHLGAADGPARLSAGGEDALRAALVVGSEFAARRGPVRLDRITEALDAPESAVRRLMDRLAQAGIVSLVAGDATAPGAAAEAYLPSRPLEAVAASDVLALTAPGEEDRLDPRVASALQEVRARIARAMEGASLGELLRGGGRPKTEQANGDERPT
jgi:membrane protein